MTILVLLVMLVPLSTAVPLDYGERQMEESVYGAATEKKYQNIAPAPLALQQVEAAPIQKYKQVIEAPKAPRQTTFLDSIALAGNQLNDYPPEKEVEALQHAGYQLNGAPSPLPVFPHVSQHQQAGDQLLYRGYPYVYGYPLDFRYGYAYGHAFGTDGDSDMPEPPESFECQADGRYYRDFGSFYNCEAGQFTVQFCAPGSRNAPPGRHLHGSAFCNVNMVGGNLPLLLPH